MFHNKRVIGIILARGGSKRLKNKNVKILGNKPLLAWTIQAANASEYIDEVLVSTDSEAIVNIATDFDARAPFLRPEALSNDEASSIDALRHTLEWLEKEEKKFFDYVVLLQPTSPLRTALHIDEAFLTLEEKNGDAVVSVCEVEHSPLWSNTLQEGNSLEGFLKPEIINSRSQDLETYYRLNGALYICDVGRLKDENRLFIKSNIYAYKMSQIDSVDLDTELDFLVAETILKQKENNYEK